MTRRELNRHGATVRQELGLTGSDISAAIGIDAFLTEAVYGALWSRPVLGREERMICTLAALSVLGRPDELRAMIHAALRVGLEPRSVVEVFAHGGLYGGFGAAEIAIELAQEVFADAGITLPVETERSEPLESLARRGQQFLEDLHGTRGTEGYASPDNPVTGALYGLATQYGYGELWQRPGLERRARLLCALAAFTVLGLDSQLRKFSVSALRVGLSREEVVEAIMQTAPYGGFPRALNALALFGEACTSAGETG